MAYRTFQMEVVGGDFAKTRIISRVFLLTPMKIDVIDSKVDFKVQMHSLVETVLLGT